MANEEHLRRLKEGVESWNAWRADNRWPRADDRWPYGDLLGADLAGTDLSGADLHHADLGGANLRGANLSGANLMGAYLPGTNLTGANLSGANLIGAHLLGADVRGTDLSGADLSEADLSDCDLDGAHLRNATLWVTRFFSTRLSGTNLTEADLAETIFADVDLSGAIGVATCRHLGPSVVDQRTLQQSGSLPIPFLRGVGLPQALIDYFFTQDIQLYSCFISYSSKDQDFANRVHADLQNTGVRCWFAPHDLPIGAKILDGIATAIRVRDKVLLILSEHSIKSDWVEDEVKTAFEEERNRGQVVLFPIRLDDEIMETTEPWAAKLRADRNIGDFRRWKDHGAYNVSLDRVVRDLTITQKANARPNRRERPKWETMLGWLWKR